MKVGLRTPSLSRRIAARTSWKRYARHSLGLKAPRGYGWIAHPERALYNHAYNRTTVSVDRLLGGRRRSVSPFGALLGVLAIVVSLLAAIMSIGTKRRRR